MDLSKRKTWFLLAILVSVVLAVYGLSRYLPVYIETKLLPRWAAAAGLDLQTIRMRRLGWNGSDLGPIRLNLTGSPFLNLDAVQIDYSIWSLLQRKIDSIVLIGLNLELTLNDQGTGIQGAQPRAPQASGAEPISLSALGSRLPVGLRRLAVRNAAVTVHWRGCTFDIPFNVELDTAGLAEGRINATGDFLPRGNTLHLACTVNTRTGTMNLAVKAEKVMLGSFSDLLAAVTPIAAMGGGLDLDAQAQWTLQPFSLDALALEARLSHTQIRTPAFVLKNIISDERIEQPIVLNLKTDPKTHWHWSLTPFLCDGPVSVQAAVPEGHILQDGRQWRVTANARTVLPQQRAAPSASVPLILRRALLLQWRLSAQAAADQSLQFELRTEPEGENVAQELSLQRGDLIAESQTPQVMMTGSVEEGKLACSFELSATDMRLALPQGLVRCPRISLKGDMAATPDVLINAIAKFPATHITFKDGRAELPRIRLETRIQHDPRSNWALTGEIILADGSVEHDPYRLQLRDLAVRLPLQWPVTKDAPAGKLEISKILWKSKDIGSLKGRIGLKSIGLWTDLTHSSKLFPGLNVYIESEAGLSGTRTSISIPGYTPPSTLDLARFWPQAHGLTAAGRLEARVELETHGAMINSNARIRLDQGVVRQANRQMVLEGIACDLFLKDLAPLQSAPRQQLRIGALTLGKLKAEALKVDFQLEPGVTLFIEKAAVQWCQGGIQAQSFRLVPGRDDVEMTLYCDRLNLAMVLEQLGAAEGSGEGAVNGRIPVRWTKGRLSFDNGFLYSTPGQTGTIQLSGTEQFLEGLPADSPQRIQLDIATEALKDYSYNWAKLKLDTQKDLLLVSLQLDGKPNRLLPFAYDPQTGIFKRFKGKGEADFQGIGIDLNFKTPLRDILQYRDLLAPKKQ